MFLEANLFQKRTGADIRELNCWGRLGRIHLNVFRITFVSAECGVRLGRIMGNWVLEMNKEAYFDLYSFICLFL